MKSAFDRIVGPFQIGLSIIACVVIAVIIYEVSTRTLHKFRIKVFGPSYFDWLERVK